MTATGYIGIDVDLVNFYTNIIINEVDKEGIVYAEFGNNKHNLISKGTNLKKRFVRVNGKKQASTRRFDNSITVKYNYINTQTEKINTLNIKIFKNGKIQMTGVKSEENGRNAIDSIIGLIKEYQSKSSTQIVENLDDLISSQFSIHLINSDFKVDIEIRRDLLATIIMDQYACTCSYEPCIYPGIKLQYFLNRKDTDLPLKEQGKCRCVPVCNGKGDGFTTDNCKKITISIFQSGCILITGVTLLKHIDIGYSYIIDIIQNHKLSIKRNKLVLPADIPCETTTNKLIS